MRIIINLNVTSINNVNNALECFINEFNKGNKHIGVIDNFSEMYLISQEDLEIEIYKINPKHIFNLADIMKMVSLYTNVDIKKMVSSNRNKEVVWSRYMYYYFCKEFTKYSLARIGFPVNRDHSSVHHGISQVKEKLELKHEKELKRTIEQIRLSLNHEIIKICKYDRGQGRC